MFPRLRAQVAFVAETKCFDKVKNIEKQNTFLQKRGVCVEMGKHFPTNVSSFPSTVEHFCSRQLCGVGTLKKRT